LPHGSIGVSIQLIERIDRDEGGAKWLRRRCRINAPHFIGRRRGASIPACRLPMPWLVLAQAVFGESAA
jgi:hypothetical protein